VVDLQNKLSRTLFEAVQLIIHPLKEHVGWQTRADTTSVLTSCPFL
jgi:hypothetical protein